MSELFEDRVRFRQDVEGELRESCRMISGQKEPESYWNDLVKILTRPPSYTTLRANIRELPIEEIGDQLQTLINQRNSDALKVERHPQLADLLIVRNIGPNQNIQKLPLEVIVDHACGMAVLRGAEIYCRGVLSMSTGISADDLVSVYADLDGLCRKGQTETFSGRRVHLGTGRALVGRRELFTDITRTGVAISMTQPLYASPSLSSALPGLVFAQNLPSIVCAHVLGAQAGEHVLDMCAAPGGKTNHIAFMMLGAGSLVALEKAKNKIGRIRESLQRWNLEENVHVHCFDSTKCYLEDADGSNATPPWLAGTFDRILLDGPCSALGQRPYYTHKLGLAELRSYPVLQRKLLQAAVPLLKTGGVLVYSTCTFAVQENEAMVAWALKHFSCLRLVEQEPYLGLPGRLGCGLGEADCAMVQRFDPVRATDLLNHDTTAFFIAKFTKV